MKPLLFVILAFAAGGLAFSGYLSYRELFATPSGQCAPVGDAGTILGAPPCVYGLFMYLVITIVTVLALTRRARAS
jgi:hypothetical protein